MKSFLSLMFFAGLSCSAVADEMADAMKAWETQNYQQAYQIFKKLADAGNPDAQRQLGEMIGFGEGVPEDAAQAEYWIKRALALGNKEAAASLETVRQRTARKPEIARYVSAYDGADLKLEKFGCVDPVIPEVSRIKKDITEVDAKMKAWRTCYDRFESNLAAFLPVGKSIPADLAALMSVDELARAKARMQAVYDSTGSTAHEHALKIIASYDQWIVRTKEFATQFAITQKADSERRQRELNETQQRYSEAIARSKAGQ